MGESDAGKTALFRAIYWVTHNRPVGSSFIRRGSEDCYVKIRFGNKTITRKKGKKGNYYKVDQKSLTAFGNDVPELVHSSLPLNDLNYQHQFDPLFWLSDSPTQISKNINEMINLGSIDKSQNFILKDIRNKKAEIRVHKERIEKYKKDRKEGAWIKSALKLLATVQEFTEKQASLRSQIAAVERLILKRDRVRVRAENAHKAQPIALRVMSEIEKLTAAEDKVKTVSKLMNSARSLTQRAKRIDKELEGLQEQQKKLEKLICPKCGRKIKE